MKRLATALILIPLVVCLILYAPSWTFIAALIVVGLFALREVVQIGKNAFVSWVGGAMILIGPKPVRAETDSRRRPSSVPGGTILGKIRVGKSNLASKSGSSRWSASNW